MKSLSNIATAIKPSSTVMIDSKAKQMKADGLDVVSFGAGEPDFDTPANVVEAGIAAIREGKTRYTPPAGIIPLRKAIADRLKADLNVDYDYTQVVIASGAKHIVFVVMQTLINPGDEVILPTPCWVSYDENIKMAGGVSVTVYAPESQDFKITPEQLEAAITDKTKAVVLNNPSNPTGMVYTEAELRALAEICVKHDLYIISDEIYFQLRYDGESFISVAALGEEVKARTILINGVAKSYAMTGWRIGYAAAPANIAKVMTSFLSHSTGAPATFSQWGAVEAYTGPQGVIEDMRVVYEQRRNYMVGRINAIDGISCRMPKGAFYVMMNIEKLKGRVIGGVEIQSGDDFAMAFLEKELVAVVPGSGFGAPDFVRWSYATSMENIEEGMNRLERFLAE